MLALDSGCGLDAMLAETPEAGSEETTPTVYSALLRFASRPALLSSGISSVNARGVKLSAGPGSAAPIKGDLTSEVPGAPWLMIAPNVTMEAGPAAKSKAVNASVLALSHVRSLAALDCDAGTDALSPEPPKDGVEPSAPLDFVFRPA